MATTLDLFRSNSPGESERIGEQAFVLRNFALQDVDDLLRGIADVEAISVPQRMVTPGGFTMSVQLANCGTLGWTSDHNGYRYSRTNPANGQPWPAMPESFARLARRAAAEAGFPGFAPDACLINHYTPGARMSLHQDRNERDFNAPIVSVSLGMSATFLFGGMRRSDKAARIVLEHGDVVVWGGVDRLRFHGIMPLGGLPHPLLGLQRINFTLRKAG